MYVCTSTITCLPLAPPLHISSPLAVNCLEQAHSGLVFFVNSTRPYRRERALYSLTRAAAGAAEATEVARVAITGTGYAIWHSPTRQRQPLANQM